MLKCKDGSLYTGWTTDLDKRVACHNAGKGAKYTRARRPVELVYFEQFQTREEAMRRECEIKKLTRKQKEELIKQKENIRHTDEYEEVRMFFFFSFLGSCHTVYA